MHQIAQLLELPGNVAPGCPSPPSLNLHSLRKEAAAQSNNNGYHGAPLFLGSFIRSLFCRARPHGRRQLSQGQPERGRRGRFLVGVFVVGLPAHVLRRREGAGGRRAAQGPQQRRRRQQGTVALAQGVYIRWESR